MPKDKLHRRDVRMTTEEWQALDDAANRCDRTGPWLLRYFVRTFSTHVVEATLPVGETTATRRCGDGAATVPESYPSPARAGTDPSERVSERVSAPSSEGGLIEIWLATEPFSLLADPPAALAMMRMAFPTTDLVAKSAEIAIWWMERDYAPSTRKRRSDERWTVAGISAGIRGWFGRANDKPPPGTTAKKGQATLDLEDDPDEIIAGHPRSEWLADLTPLKKEKDNQ